MNQTRPSILIVDDEADMRASVQLFFEKRGFSVQAASSGEDALASIKTIKSDLILLDLTLPNMTGREVLQKLREFDKEIKVIIFTGHTLDSEEEERDFYALGVSAYLNKPIKLDDLEKAIKSVLQGHDLPAGFEKHKCVQPKDPTSSALHHQIRNLLGNMRSECQVFLLNQEDGLHKDKSPEELLQMSEKILGYVIQSVDRLMDIFEKK